MMPRFYMLIGNKTDHDLQILFCELHQKREVVSSDIYIEWCKDNAEAARFGMRAVYECGGYEHKAKRE